MNRVSENKKTLPSSAILQPGKRMRWYESPQRHVDTIVFVHGILGHHVKTWGAFPSLLAQDDDLPCLDILLWGYRTGCLARHHELHLEGRHLVTAMESMIRAANNIVLVGHSMGGLIILKGLVDRMIDGLAQKSPCRAVAWISLFASPLNGVWLAGLARKIAALPLRCLKTLHKHLHALSPGTFVDDLMAEVRRRIYTPVAENDNNRRIPIRIVAATRDGAVDKKDRDTALASYTDPAPHQLDETHRSVKLPRHSDDLRYRVLANDIQTALRTSFKMLCLAATDQAASKADRAAALNEMLKRYGKIIRRRVIDTVGPIELRQAAENDALLLLATYGAASDQPPHILANLAINQLAAGRLEWR